MPPRFPRSEEEGGKSILFPGNPLYAYRRFIEMASKMPPKGRDLGEQGGNKMPPFHDQGRRPGPRFPPRSLHRNPAGG